ncbi:MAG: ABC transporter substrate-binding protein, partial [Dehalococcoidia bacterium]|nr:ABC transporter substrate-binding protein [Dehalococcoidia bacterium]
VPGLKAAGIRIVTFDRGTSYYSWPFYDVDNPTAVPLGDVRVRKALQLAINSKEMADKLFSGNAAPQIMTYVRPTAYFWDSNVLKFDPYDPEAAKKLLAEAGYASGFNTKLYDVGEGGPLSTVNLALDGYWRKIGVVSAIVPMQFAAYRPNYNPKIVPEVYNTIFTYRTNGYRDFEGVGLAYHSTKASAKNSKNLVLDGLIDKVPQTRDLAEKKKIALEATRLAKEGYTTLTVVGVFPTLGVSAKIGEVKRRVVAEIQAPVYEGLTHPK